MITGTMTIYSCDHPGCMSQMCSGDRVEEGRTRWVHRDGKDYCEEHANG